MSLDDFNKIITRCKAGITLEIDSHKANYISISDHIDNINSIYEDDDVIDEDLKSRIIEADKIFELHCYADTPIGSYKVYGSTLEEVISKAKECLELE